MGLLGALLGQHLTNSEIASLNAVRGLSDSFLRQRCKERQEPRVAVQQWGKATVLRANWRTEAPFAGFWQN